jgi:chaperonin cofactor prefoldin
VATTDPATSPTGTPPAGADPAALQETRALLADAQAKLTQMQTEMTRMGKDLAGERANGKRLFDENQQLLRERNSFGGMQTELAATKAQIEDLTRRNTDFRTQLDALAQQKRTLEQELAAKNAAGDPCESIKSDLQDIQRRYADLLNRSRDNETELALSQAQRTDFANRLADANRQINALEADVSALRARAPGAAPASGGNGDVAQLLQLKQQQVDQLDARVQSREAEVRELKARLQQATAGQQDIQSITNELAEARKKVLLLEQQLKNQPGGAANLPGVTTTPLPASIPATSGLNTNLTPANDPSPDVQAQADQILPHAFVVPSVAEKTVVRDRIVRYFASLGATYQMVDGKLFYDNVTIPEISDKPLDITFYMLRDGRGNKQLLGSFTNQDGAYLEKQKFPLETYYARLLLTQLAQ